MDGWALFFIFTLALSVGLAFRKARAGASFGRSLDQGSLGFFLFAAGAVYVTMERDELGLALIVIPLGLPLFGGAILLGIVAGKFASKA